MEKNEKTIKYMPKFIFCVLIFALIFIVFSACGTNGGGEIEAEFTQTFDEETDIYKFAYKKSVLNISREKFGEYDLAYENIQKFFDGMEKVYVLFADFFMVHDLPEIFTYNSVTQKYMESVGVSVYAFSSGAENATYYLEGMLEQYLKDIDKGLPSIVIHEVGHLYTYCSDHIWDKRLNYNSLKYVWDCEVFTVIGTEYLLTLPDFNFINAAGGNYLPVTETQRIYMKEDWYDEWVKNYQCFIHFNMAYINEKYGYDTLHEVFKEMITRNTGLDKTEMFDLFFDIYAEKTGENVKDIHFIQEELDTIYLNIQ